MVHEQTSRPRSAGRVLRMSAFVITEHPKMIPLSWGVTFASEWKPQHRFWVFPPH